MCGKINVKNKEILPKKKNKFVLERKGKNNKFFIAAGNLIPAVKSLSRYETVDLNNNFSEAETIFDNNANLSSGNSSKSNNNFLTEINNPSSNYTNANTNPNTSSNINSNVNTASNQTPDLDKENLKQISFDVDISKRLTTNNCFSNKKKCDKKSNKKFFPKRKSEKEKNNLSKKDGLKTILLTSKKDTKQASNNSDTKEKFFKIDKNSYKNLILNSAEYNEFNSPNVISKIATKKINSSFLSSQKNNMDSARKNNEDNLKRITRITVQNIKGSKCIHKDINKEESNNSGRNKDRDLIQSFFSLPSKNDSKQKALLNSHMNELRFEAKTLTYEGSLIGKVKGINDESFAKEDYMEEIEKVIKEKIDEFLKLKNEIKKYKINI